MFKKILKLTLLILLIIINDRYVFAQSLSKDRERALIARKIAMSEPLRGLKNKEITIIATITDAQESTYKLSRDKINANVANRLRTKGISVRQDSKNLFKIPLLYIKLDRTFVNIELSEEVYLKRDFTILLNAIIWSYENSINISSNQTIAECIEKAIIECVDEFIFQYSQANQR